MRGASLAALALARVRASFINKGVCAIGQRYGICA